MSYGFQNGDFIRVVKPAPRHAHTKGWEWHLGKPSKQGYWWVIFSGGKALFHES